MISADEAYNMTKKSSDKIMKDFMGSVEERIYKAVDNGYYNVNIFYNNNETVIKNKDHIKSTLEKLGYEVKDLKGIDEYDFVFPTETTIKIIGLTVSWNKE